MEDVVDCEEVVEALPRMTDCLSRKSSCSKSFCCCLKSDCEEFSFYVLQGSRIPVLLAPSIASEPTLYVALTGLLIGVVVQMHIVLELEW
ncbi:hypothetical protein LIER_39890 [Lithospermum erythrorhizon]|uniref:Uncharacterized protein n=1 Tax=Lithospermum erythrorhizon TaxID=34254 RepID=A0AAV3QPP4_LITER